MRQFTLFITLAAFVFYAQTGAALAGDWYIQGLLGHSTVKTSGSEIHGTMYSTSFSVDAGDEMETSGLAWGLGAGYDFSPYPVRLELVFMDRPGESNPARDEMVITRMDTVMFNAWLLLPRLDGPAHFYWGGGLGLAGMGYEYNADGVWFGPWILSGKAKGYSISLAFGLGLGILIDINTNFALDLGYRHTFTSFDDIELIKAAGLTAKVDTSAGIGDFILGFQYKF